MTERKAITVTNTMTEDDVAEIVLQRPMRFTGWSPRVRDRVLRVMIFVVLTCAGVGLALINSDTRPDLAEVITPVFSCSVAGLVLARLYPRFVRWAIRRNSRHYQKLPLTMTLTFDETGIASQLTDRSGHMAWSAVESAVETDRHHILYVANLMAFVVQISSIDDDCREPLRQLIKRHVSKVEVRR
jgi:hypothetical protein